MNLAEAIMGLYPDLVPNVDFVVGAGPDGKQGIEAWNNPNPRPTQADLARGWLAWIKRAKKAELASRAVGEMEALYPEVKDEPRKAIWIAVVSALSNAQDPRMANVKGLRDKLARGHGAVDAKTVPAEVQAMSWEDQ